MHLSNRTFVLPIKSSMRAFVSLCEKGVCTQAVICFWRIGTSDSQWIVLWLEDHSNHFEQSYTNYLNRSQWGKCIYFDTVVENAEKTLRDFERMRTMCTSIISECAVRNCAWNVNVIIVTRAICCASLLQLFDCTQRSKPFVVKVNSTNVFHIRTLSQSVFIATICQKWSEKEIFGAENERRRSKRKTNMVMYLCAVCTKSDYSFILSCVE